MTYEDELPMRQPKGDHNRRISLGLDDDHFAIEAGVTVEELGEYERTPPDHRFDIHVAHRIGEALDRLEKYLPSFQTGRNVVGVRPQFRPSIASGNESSRDTEHPLYQAGGDEAKTRS